MIDTLIFDMGNVLSDYTCDPVIRQVTNDEKEIQLICNLVFNSSEWIMLDAGTIGYQEAIENIISRIDDQLLKEKVEYCYYHWHEYNLTMNKGIIKILDYAHQNHYKTYILSNAGLKTLEVASQFIPYYDKFDGIIFSAQIQLIKPMPAIYHYIQNKYNIVPGNALFIDDLKRNVDSAIDCGFNGYCYHHDDDQLLQYIKSH